MDIYVNEPVLKNINETLYNNFLQPNSEGSTFQERKSWKLYSDMREYKTENVSWTP